LKKDEKRFDLAGILKVNKLTKPFNLLKNECIQAKCSIRKLIAHHAGRYGIGSSSERKSKKIIDGVNQFFKAPYL